MWKTASAVLVLLAFDVCVTAPALAAGCASPTDASALRTAVMQQELMVAAFQCRESAAYNQFVTAYQSELQSSDAALKAFFVRRGGEHGEFGYDSFKTKAANLSALEQARNAGAFCADAHALFSGVLAHRGSLMSFVDAKSGDAGLGNICVESRPAPVLAKADVKPAVKLAQALPADSAVGVPSYSQPAIPYRGEDRAAPPDRILEDRDAVEEDSATYATDVDDAPPPAPRYYPIRNRDYDDSAYYSGGAYGPPPNWQRDWRGPAPRYGWRPRDPYRW